MLVGFHTIPLLTFDLQVKLFTHQPPSNDGDWLLVGVQGSSVLLYFYSIGPSKQIVAPRLLEAWGTKYPNFEATGISKAIERLSHSLSCQAERS